MPLTDTEYREALESVREVFKNADDVHVMHRGSHGRDKGLIGVSFDRSLPNHLRFFTPVRLNELRRRGFVIIAATYSGIQVQHSSCHNPDKYSYVWDDR